MKKIGICFYGYLTDWFDESIDSLMSAIKINKDVEIDMFFHTWVKNDSEKEEVTKKIKEKTVKIVKECIVKVEKQKEFSAREKKEFNAKSKMFSMKSAINLLCLKEKSKNFKYDYVLLTRHDIAWFKDVNFNDIEHNRMYVPGPKRDSKINDLFYIGNSFLLSEFCKVYDKMENNLSCWTEQIDGVAGHQHRIQCKFLKELNMFDDLGYYLDRPWGRSQWHGDIRALRLKP
jgi:hypothetical protein